MTFDEIRRRIETEFGDSIRIHSQSRSMHERVNEAAARVWSEHERCPRCGYFPRACFCAAEDTLRQAQMQRTLDEIRALPEI